MIRDQIGLQIDFSRDIAMGLPTNTIERQQNHWGGGGYGQPFIYELFTEYLREIGSPKMNEQTSMEGPKVFENKFKKISEQNPLFLTGLYCNGGDAYIQRKR
jgi:hypothetical protein